MRLIFCVREHTFDEIYMGHQLGFPAIRGIGMHVTITMKCHRVDQLI